MNVTRFMFENPSPHPTGSVTPPYSEVERIGGNMLLPAAYHALRNLRSEELHETLLANALATPMTLPLRIARADDPAQNAGWTLPVEPLITVSGKNLIVRRQISKGKVRGSVKEKWTQDDYSIKINGLLMDPLNPEVYPADDVKTLKDYCEAGNLTVLCPLLELFGIKFITVESYEFPFTKGKGNQAYSISAYSDNIHQLLLEGDDLIYN